jgi:hypothetical protein
MNLLPNGGDDLFWPNPVAATFTGGAKLLSIFGRATCSDRSRPVCSPLETAE